MPLKPKACPNCGETLPWYLDTSYLADFARRLAHNPRLLFSGPDTHQFYEDPRGWIRENCEGDPRVEFEAERKVAA
jgi:hypothetical protein